MSRLILILGDQLSLGISSLDGADKGRDTVLMCEVMAEATYVGHHKKKIAFIFSAMRHFADELRGSGYKVRYTRIDDPDNAGSFTQRATIEPVPDPYASQSPANGVFSRKSGVGRAPLALRSISGAIAALSALTASFGIGPRAANR